MRLRLTRLQLRPRLHVVREQLLILLSQPLHILLLLLILLGQTRVLTLVVVIVDAVLSVLVFHLLQIAF